MTFGHEGYMYLIDFQREHKSVRVGVTPEGEDVFAPSRFPYTTVNLFRMTIPVDPINGKMELYRTATVGAWHKEKFTLEKGRIHALRSVSTTLPKDLKNKLWQAYMGRNK